MPPRGNHDCEAPDSKLIRVEINGKLFEGTSETTDDLKDEKTITALTFLVTTKSSTYSHSQLIWGHTEIVSICPIARPDQESTFSAKLETFLLSSSGVLLYLLVVEDQG
jgi:hypothetical protein